MGRPSSVVGQTHRYSVLDSDWDCAPSLPSRRQLTDASDAGACSGLLEAIARESAEFNESLRESTGIVAASTIAALARPSAAYTVLLPPANQLAALVAAFRRGDFDRATAQSTLLLHIIPQHLGTADLLALGADAAVHTLSRAGNLTVAVTGDESISFALSGGGQATVTEADIQACGGPSVLHRVDALLTSAQFPLPAGAIPPPDLGGGGGPGAALGVGVALGCAAAVLMILSAAVFLRRRCAPRPQRAARTKDPVPQITTNSDRPKLLPLEVRGSDGPGHDVSTMSQSWNPVATLSEFSGDDGDSSTSAAVLHMPGAFLTPGASELAGAAAVSLSAATGDPSSSTRSAQRTQGALFSTAGTTPGSSAPRGADTAAAAAAADTEPPLPGARAEERRQWLHCQLDSIGSTPLLRRFVLLGPAERRSGEDTVVQFARSTADDEEFALKFFISREKFEAERTVFAHWILGAMMPRLEGMYDNRDAALQDPRGHALPPCVIMERGESLQEWFKRRKPDLRTALPVVAHIAKRVAGMHRGGYVHRDLKPSNIMWLPGDSQWSLIDFGAAAEIGRPAPLNVTLPYAAPEVVAASVGGRTSVTATHALDAWALGVGVFEMVTGRPAFDMESCSDDDVREALLGQARLPWERLGADDRRRLGPFKAALLLLLQRDPLMRPSLDLFYHKCIELLK